MRFTEYVKTARAHGPAHRRSRRPDIAFVLSGGGVLGAVHVGQLQALLAHGIIPDVVVGTSVGSLNGAAVACEPTLPGVERLAEVWRGLKSTDIFPGSRVAQAWNIVAGGDHVHSNEGIRRLVRKLPARLFEEMSVPLWLSATNLHTGEERWFSSGPIMPAILASSALPGLFPPVAIDGEQFVDGGVVNNVPISKAVELGARRIYVLTCGSPLRTRPIRRPLDVLVQAFAHAREVRTSHDIAHFSERAEIVMMPTFDLGNIPYNDATHSASLIERAREASSRHLSKPEAAQA